MFGLLAASIPVFLLQAFDFWSAFNLVMIIMIWIALHNMFYPELLGSRLLAVVITTAIVWLVVVPFEWFRILLFIYFFMYAFFWQFNPWTWGSVPTQEELDAEAVLHQKLTHGYPHHGVFD